MEPNDSFNITLSPREGEGGLHTKNPPKQPFQRATIHEDRRSINIGCSLVDVVHGHLSPDEEEYASLIVLSFRFDPSKRGRRIMSAKITVTFLGADDDDEHPGVAGISLNGSYSLIPSTQTETITSGVNGSAGISVLSTGNLSLEKNYERVISRETSDATYVSGSTCHIGVDWDPANAVEWKLRENATLKSGIPAQLRAGILLKRDNLEQFRCMVQIESEVDAVSSVGRWFGGKPKDDPVLFDPTILPTNRLMKYDKDDLGNFDLSLVEDVTFTTILDSTIKNHSTTRQTQPGI
ncbi:hypothetical protein N7456_010856 [Penicillium angulare]|uniref:Uncharacterized protein n=1 Tax=Penicillium angulare TaxID=116970 RepID=A0A9W9JZI3_9EURO|nr:hypothetical protein N7456_010856 [Penicillium angulare]